MKLSILLKPYSIFRYGLGIFKIYFLLFDIYTMDIFI